MISSVLFFSLALTLLSSSTAVAGEEVVTSVWCHGSHQSHRHCSFQNLCYSPETNQMIFFHDRKTSVISGVDAPAEQIRLARLSSMEGLEENVDDLYLDYTMLPAQLSKKFRVDFVDKKTLFMKRWRPDRLQNVFHDDLIPIFFTMKQLCYGNATECLDKYQIVIMDALGKSSPFEDLYAKILRPATLIYQQELRSSDRKHLICYRKSTVGLEIDTLWHDYGFYLNGKEGPRENPNFRPNYLEDFRLFTLNQLMIDNEIEANEEAGKKILFLLPDIKSRLKNADDVISALRQVADIKLHGQVEVHDPDKDSVTDLILRAASSKLMVGFTGSSMIASLFLPKVSSAVVELFPFGLGPDVSSFIETLCRNRGLVYHSWVNRIRSNSISHPELEPELGGLGHLDPAVRRAIENMDHVGDVKCCDDPAFLHKFFQETFVDVKSLNEALSNAVEDMSAEVETTSNELPDEWMLPSKIYDASCTLKKSSETGKSQIFAEVSWKRPLNLDHIPYKSVVYEVVAQADLFGEGVEMIGEYSTQDTTATFSFASSQLRKFRVVKVWVAVLVDHDLRGSDVFVRCNLDSMLIM